jgi:hypothetical protein
MQDLFGELIAARPQELAAARMSMLALSLQAAYHILNGGRVVDR